MTEAPDVIELILKSPACPRCSLRPSCHASPASQRGTWETLHDHPSSPNLFVLFQFDHNHGALDSFIPVTCGLRVPQTHADGRSQ